MPLMHVSVTVIVAASVEEIFFVNESYVFNYSILIKLLDFRSQVCSHTLEICCTQQPQNFLPTRINETEQISNGTRKFQNIFVSGIKAMMSLSTKTNRIE